MKMLINGKSIDASDKKTFDVINPATLEVIDTVPAATESDVEMALDAAQQGKREWRKVLLHNRVTILRKFNSLLESKLDEFAKIMCAETGKTLLSCIDETKACIGIFESYCEKAKNYGGETLPLNSESRVEGDIIFTIREPLDRRNAAGINHLDINGPLIILATLTLKKIRIKTMSLLPSRITAALHHRGQRKLIPQ